jgi:hypothetical protein
MYKFMLIFYQPEALYRFEDAYNHLLARLEQMPHIIRRQVINVTGSPAGPSRIYRILEVYYPDQSMMEASLRSPQGQLAGAAIQQFEPESFEMVFADVYEEAGGFTPKTED